MRTGCRTLPGRRQFSMGLSAVTVPLPARMAGWSCRSSCTRARAGSPVTQRESPVCVAIFPSSVIAVLKVTHGMRVVIYFRNTRFRWRISSPQTPHSTSMPASRRRAMPCPATRGLGSAMPTTTRAMPSPMTASVQGGVLPWWQQGSSVTYSVAPRADSRQAAKAFRSACGPPQRSCHPCPMMRPSRTTTAPTSGLGFTHPAPFPASSMARRINAMSVSVIMRKKIAPNDFRANMRR